MATDRLDEVLDAAYDCLTRYGVRRTTMDDIALQHGRVPVGRLPVRPQQGRRLPATRRPPAHPGAAAGPGGGHGRGRPVRDTHRGVLAAKLDMVRRPAGDSPHTAELLDK
jgi:hypothetical protein